MAVSCRAVGSTVSARLHGVKHFLSIKRNLDSALKIYEVLAARHLYFYLITARARKNKRTARMLASARKDHSIPLILILFSASGIFSSLQRLIYFVGERYSDSSVTGKY